MKNLSRFKLSVFLPVNKWRWWH